jgi:membrane fusion protein (multidrug efflux system)
MLVGGVRYFVWSRHHESTDDAFIDCHVVHVAPRVAGQVLRVHVTDNQPVEAGDLLVEIDPAEYRASLDEATAARDEARGRLSQARAQLRVAESSQAEADADIEAARADAHYAASDLARYHATRTGAVSKQSIDSASTTATRSAAHLVVKQKARVAADATVELAHAQIEAAQADVAAADAAVEQAQLQLSYTRIYAADSGLVTQKSVMQGDYLHVGQQIFALVPSRVWVTANFKETQLRHMRPGQPVVIHVDAYDRDFKGRVDSIQAGSGSFFSLLPPQNATGNYVKVVQRIPVKIVFDEATEPVLLGPGMSVEPTVRIE